MWFLQHSVPCGGRSATISLLLAVGLRPPSAPRDFPAPCPRGVPQLGCFVKQVRRISRANQPARWRFIYLYVITEFISHLSCLMLFFRRKSQILPIFDGKGLYGAGRENHRAATLEGGPPQSLLCVKDCAQYFCMCCII